MLEQYLEILAFGLVIIFWGMLSGAIAHTWVEILTKEGMVFYKVKQFFEKMNLPKWLSDPIIGCNLCNAGQIALWTFTGAVLVTSSSLFMLLGVIPCAAVSIITAQRLDR